MSRTRSIYLAVGLLAAPAYAGAGKLDGPPTEIRRVYCQYLPRIGWAYVDARGDAWLATHPECSIEESYGRQLKLMPGGDEPILFDRSGRLWLNKRYDGLKPTRCYDGKKWRTLDFRARSAFEDKSGRCHFADVAGVHVLESGRWTRHKLLDKPNSGVSWHFAEGPAGGVWLWAGYDSRGWPKGLWHYAKGRWKHYGVDGWPSDRLSTLIPLADGELLLIFHQLAGKANYVRWQPDRTRPLGPAAGEFLPGCTAKRVFSLGTDIDGNHFLSADGLVKGGIKQDQRYAVACFTPEGKGRLLSTDAEQFLSALWHCRYRSIGWPRDRLHFSLRDKRTWDGRRLHPPGVPGDILCVDRHGRIYCRTRSNEVAVIWPKHEKPGDVIRPGFQQRAALGRVFADRAGGIWCLSSDGPRPLRRWNGKAWTDTPLRVLPHPHWRMRVSPPWRAWSRPPQVLLGKSGSLLVVVVRDIHQDLHRKAQERGDDPAAGQAGLSPPALARQGKGAGGLHGRAEEGKDPFWLEVYIRRNGEWIGPMQLEHVLRIMQPWLLKEFAVHSGDSGFVSLVGDGKRIWAAYDGMVRHIGPDGKVRAWPIPVEGDWKRVRLPPVRLVRPPGGNLLCIWPESHRKSGMAYLKPIKGGIVAELYPKDALPSCPKISDYRFHLAGDGSLWASCGHLHSPETFQWDGAKWRPWPALGRLCCEDGSGAIWFWHKPKPGRSRQYAIWKDGKVALLPWPAYLPVGPVSRVAKDRLLASCYRCLATLVPDEKAPAGWRIGRTHVLAGYIEQGPVLYDGKGAIVGPNGWTAPYDPTWAGE